MSFDIVWTKAFKWWERPLGYYRLLKARKNYGTRIRIANPLTSGHFFRAVPGYQEKLRRLRNIHEGSRCFVIGNGPSLRRMDLKLLRNEITIGSNGIFKLFPKMGFHTTYLTMEDVEQCEDRRREHKHIKGPIKIYALNNAYCVPSDDSTLFMNVYRHQMGEQRFSEDCSEVLYSGWTVTYLNLQLAFHLGCDPVYLIGVDFSYGRIGDSFRPGVIDVTAKVMKDIRLTHFDPSYHKVGSRFGVPHVDKQYRSFQKAHGVYEKHARRIYNAGLDSELDVFEKVDYADLFNNGGQRSERHSTLLKEVSPNDEIRALLTPNGIGRRWKRLYDRAESFYKSGLHKRALRLVEKSVASKPNIPAYYLMGRVKKSLGDTDGASKVFELILDKDGPRLDLSIYSGAYYHLGEMNYRQRNLLEAQYHLEQCINMSPSHEKAIEYLERIRAECDAESFIPIETQMTST